MDPLWIPIAKKNTFYELEQPLCFSSFCDQTQMDVCQHQDSIDQDVHNRDCQPPGTPPRFLKKKNRRNRGVQQVEMLRNKLAEAESAKMDVDTSRPLAKPNPLLGRGRKNGWSFGTAWIGEMLFFFLYFFCSHRIHRTGILTYTFTFTIKKSTIHGSVKYARRGFEAVLQNWHRNPYRMEVIVFFVFGWLPEGLWNSHWV